MLQDEDLVLDLPPEDADKPSRVDGYAERLILAKDAQDAKQRAIEQMMEKYHTRHARFQLVLFLMVIGGVWYLIKIGCWEMIRDFFVSMSQ